MPTPVSRLMADLRSINPTSPRLTWYGPDGERVELSGRVLDNWVAKTANLLVDELDAGPGTSVRLALPAHWRSLVWALAVWQAGGTVVLGPAEADIEVTDHPAESAGRTTAAVALGALQMSWPGALPAGVIDYAAEVRAHGDVFVPFDEPLASDAALLDGEALPDGEATASFEDLGGRYPRAAAHGSRLLIRAGDGLAAALPPALGAWLAGGSVVLVHPEVEVSERLLASEQISGSGAAD